MKTEGIFDSLSERQSMLLASLVMREGGELNVLQLLPDDERMPLESAAKKLLEVPGERRAALIAREVRTLLCDAGGHHLEGIEPTWIAEMLSRESIAVARVLWRQFPVELRETVANAMPSELRSRCGKEVPTPSISMALRREVLRLFVNMFERMPPPPTELEFFSFQDMNRLSVNDLRHVVRWLGLRRLASAFLGLGRRVLGEFSIRLDEDSKEGLLKITRSLTASDIMGPRDATIFLREAVGETGGSAVSEEQLIQKAGLWDLATACKGERPVFVRQLAQRMRWRCGQSFMSLVEHPPVGAHAGRESPGNVRNGVLEGVESLVMNGTILCESPSLTIVYDDASAVTPPGEYRLISEELHRSVK